MVEKNKKKTEEKKKPVETVAKKGESKKEEKPKQEKEKTEEKKKTSKKPQEKTEKETNAKKEEKSDDKKKEKPKKKGNKVEKKKKDKAEVNAKSVRISTKHSIAICNYIRGETIQQAIEKLDKVVKKKVAVPMRGEIAHKKGKGFTASGSGKYPEKAAGEFIKLLKGLNANAEYNEVENPYVKVAISNEASRPYRRFGSRRARRTHVYLQAKSVEEK